MISPNVLTPYKCISQERLFACYILHKKAIRTCLPQEFLQAGLLQALIFGPSPPLLHFAVIPDYHTTLFKATRDKACLSSTRFQLFHFCPANTAQEKHAAAPEVAPALHPSSKRHAHIFPKSPKAIFHLLKRSLTPSRQASTTELSAQLNFSTKSLKCCNSSLRSSDFHLIWR